MIEGAAEAAYPEEACGLLLGHGALPGPITVTEVVKSANVASGDRRRRFEVDPAVRFGVERRLRGTPQQLIGHYHSHPDGVARPSDHDVAQAYEPGLVWLIVAVADGKSQHAKAWALAGSGGNFEPITLDVAV